jgi:hypothetical protein
VILNPCLDPTTLDLPADWCHIRGQLPQRRHVEEPEPPLPLSWRNPRVWVKCPQCGQEVRRSQLAQHKKWDHDRRATHF